MAQTTKYKYRVYLPKGPSIDVIFECVCPSDGVRALTQQYGCKVGLIGRA
jgi:hypothetical protein